MPNAIEEILRSIEGLDPFPHVAVQVFQLALLDETTPRDLVEVIQTDPGITAKVLRLSNSAAFGPRVEVTSLVEAANRLGTRVLTSMVWTTCAQGFYMGLGASSLSSNRQLWEETTTTAVACRMIAGMGHGVEPNLAFTIGLLQNMGHIVMDRFLTREREAIQRDIECGRLPIIAERRALGIHHAELGGRMAERWHFPDVLVQAIRHHHTPHTAIDHVAAAAVGNLGEAVACAALGQRGPDAPAYGIAVGAEELANLEHRDLPALREMLLEELERYRSLIEENARV
jgi:HD-like signal output (HDOD) protein